jgi:hypothetical protein
MRSALPQSAAFESSSSVAPSAASPLPPYGYAGYSCGGQVKGVSSFLANTLLIITTTRFYALTIALPPSCSRLRP